MNKNSIKIVVVDYGMGNLFSVQQACEHFGFHTTISADKTELLKADAMILPGVGAFPKAMENLVNQNLVESIRSYIDSGRPFLGICLGMQILFSRSEEFENCSGLNIIPGQIIRFPKKQGNHAVKVPHYGWSQIRRPESTSNWESSPLRGLKNGAHQYFVHSYYCKPDDPTVIHSLTSYGDTTYCSSLKMNNIFATQFHPEKSGPEGMTVIREWLHSISVTS